MEFRLCKPISVTAPATPLVVHLSLLCSITLYMSFLMYFSCTCIVMLISSFALFPVIFPYIEVHQRKSKMKLMFGLPLFYLLLRCANQALGEHA